MTEGIVTATVAAPVPGTATDVAPTADASAAHAVAQASGSHAAMSPRTRLILEGKIVPTLLRLALPNVAVMVVQAAIGALESYYVSGLGTDALAGVALVFPVLMIMQTMSAGAMGGGVSSAIARALGAGKRDEAQALVLHAVWIALGFGAFFMALVLGFGPGLYRALGGTGGALAAAVLYSNLVFIGSIPLWMMNTLANVLRGTGNMIVPAIVTLSGAVIPIVISPALIYGWGPFPRLEVAGAGVAIIAYYSFGTLWLVAYLLSGRGALRLAVRGMHLRWTLFRDILRVGLMSSVGSLIVNLTVIACTGLVGTFGTAAIAGYGIGSRLEYMQIPLIFGFGAALVAMVGTNIGAQQMERAHRVAWIGASMAGGVTMAIGVCAAIWPLGWAGLFSQDPAVLDAAVGYLQRVAPAYGFMGLGLALYFASQGAGRMGWPVLSGVVRMVVAVAGSWIAVRVIGTGLHGIFVMIAVAMVLFGPMVALPIAAGSWRRGR
jgi:putative MATE family efflux protein